MKDLVFATNNLNKLEEVRAILGQQYRIKSLDDIGCSADIPETGETFADNAGQKSAYILQNYGLDCFADDSGLMVEALNNEPGVYSARYSGSRDMQANMALLLERLAGRQNRKACFVTVISLRLEGKEYFFEGRIDGHIGWEPKGKGGFGYDPLFIPQGHTRTFAELDPAVKNRISHRAIAVRKLLDFLLA
jgi:XTP/dITP diphosphohydrolase